MKLKFILAHLEVASVYAKLSTCKRLQVGCLLVKGGTPIAIGYNGTKPGACNCCEDTDGNTLPSVRHAEINALNKLWTSKESAEGAIAFITDSPCPDCVQDLYNAGIREIYFSKLYRLDEGIRWGLQRGMKIYHVKEAGIYGAALAINYNVLSFGDTPPPKIEYHLIGQHT